ncbi:MAG: OmpA family protein [Bacteroidota bacterium]
MRLSPIILSLFISFLFSCSSFAQEKKIRKAFATYEIGEYFNAIELLKEAYDYMSSDDMKNETVFKIAMCYRKLNQVKKSELWFNKAIKRGYDTPVVFLYYAQALLIDEKYEEAVEYFKKYTGLVPDDPRGERGITSCKVAKELKENPTGHQVEEAHFFNKKSNDYAPVFAREDYNVIYFTSSREGTTGDQVHGATGEQFSDIFSSQKDKRGIWSVPVPLGENINTEHAEGAASLNGAFNVIYFTRCEKGEKKAKGCQIYSANKDGDIWGNSKPLELLKNDSLVAAHPSISSGGEKLYFTSDMPGGYGGKDIWVVEGGEGNWGKPQNMGNKINTRGNELFPFIHADGTLYFSSDGHIGMGGLDIYKASKNEEGEWEVMNMGYPVNSHADDFGITIEKDYERGFYSSSRGYGNDDDIYSFYLPKLRFNILGAVKDKNSLDPLPNANVKLVGSDGMTMNTTTNEQGEFKFMLKPATDYVFIASAEDHLKDKAKVSTKGLSKSKDFEETILLASTKVPIEVPNIFYDLDKWTLRPESKKSLNKLVETLNENPHIIIELRAHTDFRGDEEYNKELSQKRAQSVVDYLIVQGVDPERLVAKGYGETMPKVVDERIHKKVPFFDIGTKLDKEFIEKLTSEDQKEIAHQINRRTEFKVLSRDFNKDEN